MSVQTDWLEESLAFAVPLHMDDLDRRASAMPGNYATNVRALCTRLVEDSPTGSTTSAQLIGTLGDALLGESRPGRATALHNVLARGLAGTALTTPNGATYRNHHWHNPMGCTCKEGEQSGNTNHSAPTP